MSVNFLRHYDIPAILAPSKNVLTYFLLKYFSTSSGT